MKQKNDNALHDFQALAAIHFCSQLIKKLSREDTLYVIDIAKDTLFLRLENSDFTKRHVYSRVAEDELP